MGTKPKLSEHANRLHECESREVASILNMLIGGLCNFVPLEQVRAAVRWIAETDELWDAFASLQHTVINPHTLGKEQEDE